MECLEKAVTLYQGEFLEEFYLRDNPIFYERLQKSDVSQPTRASWIENSRLLAERIRQRRLNQPVLDVQALLDENRVDLEGRYGE